MNFRSIISSLFFFSFLFFISPVYAQEPSGEQLERNLFNAVKEKNWESLESMIAPYAQTINSDKIRNRSELISYIKSLKFEDYQFNNFTVTNDDTGNIMVVTYHLTYQEKVGAKPQAGKKIKNLSVWQKNNGVWQWIAHAVID